MTTTDQRVHGAEAGLVDAQARLAAIADAHRREVGPAGSIGDYCVECEWRWPCPTYRWANGDVATSESWDGDNGRE